MPIKLEQITAFVAIAEAGSISAAARRLNLPTSVASERLAGLERELGTRLLQRTTRSSSLTEDGVAFLPRARNLMRDLQNAVDEVRRRRHGLTGPLRLAAPLSFGQLHLGPALYPLLTAHPDLELTLELDDRYVDIASSGFDGAVRIGAVSESRLVSKRLTTSRRVLVASPAYLERHGRPTNCREIGTHRAIGYLNRGANDWQFRFGRRTEVIRLRPALLVNNGDVMRDAAIAGLGIALLPTFLLRDAIGSGALEVVDIGGTAAIDTVQLVYPRSPTTPTKIKVLERVLRLAFGQPPYWDA